MLIQKKNSPMVQQLSLFGSVSSTQIQLTLDTLATLSGSRPTHYENITLLTSPMTIVKYEPNSKNTQYEQHKLHFKTTFTTTDHSKYEDWILQTSDIPSAGKRKISTQTILESYIKLQKNQTFETLLNDLGYTIESRYVVKGERVFYGSITIEVFQIFLIEEDGTLKNIDDYLHVVKAFINVEKSTDVENLTKASQELLSLKTDLQGLTELEMPDRNSMDSRIGLRK